MARDRGMDRGEGGVTKGGEDGDKRFSHEEGGKDIWEESDSGEEKVFRVLEKQLLKLPAWVLKALSPLPFPRQPQGPSHVAAQRPAEQ